MIRDVLAGAFEIPVYFDYPATFIWALSGALLAARLRMDPTGVAIIALVTAAGGGLLRDGLFLQAGPPALLRTPVYIVLIGIAAVIVITAGPSVLHIPHFDRIVALIDVFGRGGSLKSSWYGDCLPSRDFPMLVDLYQQGRLDLDAFVTEEIGIGDIEAAFDKMHHGDVLRSVVIL